MLREDVLRASDEVFARFDPAPGSAKQFFIRTTSGTTVRPLVILSELRLTVGLRDRFAAHERIVLCFGARGSRLFNALAAFAVGGPHRRVLALDFKDLSAMAASLLGEFEPDWIIGFPSFVLRMPRYMTDTSRAAVRALSMAGEVLTTPQEAYLRRMFPNAAIDMTYACAEIGMISEVECGYLPRNQYHVHPLVTLQIADPDEEGMGRILVSTKRSGIVFSDYDLGDLGRFRKEACQCGKYPVLEVVGRAGYDFIKLTGATLHKKEFDRVVALFEGVIEDYRVEASEVFEDGIIKAKVLVKIVILGLGATPALQKEIVDRMSSELFVTPTRTLAQMVAQGHFVPLEVEFLSAPFTPRHKEHKLRRLN